MVGLPVGPAVTEQGDAFHAGTLTPFDHPVDAVDDPEERRPAGGIVGGPEHEQPMRLAGC